MECTFFLVPQLRVCAQPHWVDDACTGDGGFCLLCFILVHWYTGVVCFNFVCSPAGGLHPVAVMTVYKAKIF